ncbi:adenylate/guanylate cyclase domain-containing protein [Janibacter sp. Soil728]|uniref:adenylate/guanylate cyclase domain-containing protein n=1 Tax=Janibacter sp. Soil728 TaxID=1736393 RepID=UPI0012E70DCD|nr:adenylate/guanylate cyclase domain-containing protein [Janibacter sp. Soil728]
MPASPLRPYVPDLAAEWLRGTPAAVHREIEGSMAFVDLSGFTNLTERLTRLGLVGSEELSDILSATFAAMLEACRQEDADLIKWGGDAVLLLFRGADHAGRAVRATTAMRRALYTVGRTRSSAGKITLRMSVGIHSGRFDFFLVGDPAVHRELIVSGPAASRTAQQEAAASAGQIAASAETAALLPIRAFSPSPTGFLLRRAPVARPDAPVGPRRGLDPDNIACLIPPPVRAHLLAETGEDEHRFIAVSFIQFSGTDSLMTRSGADAVAGALDRLVRATQRACEAHGVTFLESDINVDGGKIMLVCGAPERGEDVEDRMVRAVREIVDGATDLPLRAGINAGRVFSADFGPEFRRSYSLLGDCINVAARVMGKASPGQVMTTKAVLARVGSGIVSEEVAPLTVKGKSRPIEAALVRSIRPQDDTTSPDRARQLMLGRGREVAVIAEALDQARAGRSQYIEIVGAAGLGKSALVETVREQYADGFVVVRGPSRRFGGAVAHQAVRRLLRDVIGIPHGCSMTDQVAALHRAVTASAAELLPWFPLLAALLGAQVPDTPELSDLDDRFRPARAADSLMTLLAAVCSTPTLFVLEGVDDMDEASADLVRRIIADRSAGPWAVVTTRRTPVHGLRIDPADEPTRLTLEPLDEATSLALLEEWTQEQPLSESLLRAVVAKADGNPLFLRSLLDVIRVRGSLVGLPDGVEEVIGAAIGALPPRVRTILRFASVLGELFSLADLDDLVSEEHWTVRPEDLRELHGQLRSERSDETMFRFTSSLVLDVAYAGLPYRLRRRLHLRAGTRLEASDATPRPLELLSTHFFEAGEHSKAWTYSRLAAERARAAYSYLEAMALYERALTAAARVEDVSKESVGEVHEAIGDVAEMSGLSEAAIAHYRRARSGFRAQGLARIAVMAKEVGIHQRVGAFGTSLRIAGHARRSLVEVDGPDADALRSRLALQMAFVHHLRASHESAIHWSQLAVTEAARSGDPDVLARAHNGHALILAVAGVPTDRPYGELALARAEETGDLLFQGKCLTNLAIAAIIDGRWPVAEELLDRAAIVIDRVGDTANAANARYNRCDVLVRQGRWSEVEQVLASVGRSASATGDLELVALVRLELGKVRVGQCRLTEGREHLEDARAQLAVLGLDQEAADADLAILGSRVADVVPSRDPDAIRADITGLLARAGDLGVDGLAARLHFLLGTLFLQEHDPDAACGCYQAGIASRPGEGGFERALNQLGAAVAADVDGRPRPVDRARADEALARLGVRALPLPLGWPLATSSTARPTRLLGSHRGR